MQRVMFDCIKCVYIHAVLIIQLEKKLLYKLVLNSFLNNLRLYPLVLLPVDLSKRMSTLMLEKPFKILNVSIRSPCKRRTYSKGRCRVFNLSLYDNLDISLISLVDLCCTFSSSSMSFFKEGDQTGTQYSR